MGNKLNNSYIRADNIISSLGFTTQENISAIEFGKTGIKYDDSFEIANFPIYAARIAQESFEHLLASHVSLSNYTKMEQLLILSIEDLKSQASIDFNSKQTGLILSSTKGNIDLLSNTITEIDTDVYLWKTADKVARYFGLVESPYVVSNACISGVSALLIAHRMICDGRYNQVIVAGVDVLSHFITSGFNSFHSLSEKPCKPYDARRNGLTLGEACGSILLTADSSKDAIVVRGGAISNDANHISGPSRDGSGLFYAISSAMKNAGIDVSDVDFLNLHGTATVYNDEMEAKAVHLSALEQVPINSLKSYFGHTLGASGIIESIVCMYQLKNHIVYGTKGYLESGTSMGLKVSGEAQRIDKSSVCVKTVSGFGGCNAALVLSTSGKECEKKLEKASIELLKSCQIEQSSIVINNSNRFNGLSDDFTQFIREAYRELKLSNSKFYKMDNLCKLGYIAASCLLMDEKITPDTTGVILANSASSLDTDIKHNLIISEDGDLAASPSCFVYTLPNIVAGEICIQHKLRSENTFFIAEKYNEEEMLYYTRLAMYENNMDYCICGWCEVLGERYKADFRLYRKITN